MTSDRYFIHGHALAAGLWDGAPPLRLLDLSGSVESLPPFPPPPVPLPPCPLIGVGDARHPLAHRLDMVLESPVRLESLVESITAHPHAAAVTVQLLRGIEGQGVEAALVQESIAYGLLQGGAEHGAWLAARARVKTGAGAKPSPEGALRLERVGGRLDLLIDRPASRNAIDRALRDALREALLVATLDPDVRAVTLRGAGKAFCVGADLDEFGTTRDPVVAHAIRMATLPAPLLAACGERLSVHVQGACVGAGLEMAAFAGRVTATANSWFHLPELAMGLLPGAGGCVSVSRRIGRQRAGLMILSGRRIDAATALSWGLIDAIVQDDPAEDGGADIAG
ncbi:enoyl-CoA hydratase/isomerase family protein [Sphingobium sufflavum]|uniref:enoyl-CoA hydratase/isomerase family protein n=1 Tax=Sphingobium sufflavum TaxID=1129547 RepID=UPI001F469A2A|nr:enoyl-CoA hydratase/isomerase family protein [Sphingobium sufflavum]MCE7796871.1 enoyl-CoA hydratase/isomerase family protein [Sphingobium sufflavum]